MLAIALSYVLDGDRLWVEAVTSEQGRGLDEPGAVVTLPPGADWPGLAHTSSTRPNSLVRRHFYDPLLDTVLNGMRPFKHPHHGGQLHRVVLIGSPGISKSVLGVYAAAKALRAGRPVVHATKEGYHFAAYPNGRVRRVESHAVDPFMRSSDAMGAEQEVCGDNTDAVLICDGMAPSISTTAFTIVLATPQSSLWRDYCMDGGAARLFLPNYTLAELLELRAAAFPHVSIDDVVRRYRLYGGNPRLVLVFTDESARREVLSFRGFFNRDKPLVFASQESLDCRNMALCTTTKGEDAELGLSPTQPEFYEFAGVAPSTPYTAAQLLEQVEAEPGNLLGQLGLAAGTGAVAAVASMALAHRVVEELRKGMLLKVALYPLGEPGACVTVVGEVAMEEAEESGGSKSRECTVCGASDHDECMHKPGRDSAPPQQLVVEAEEEHIVDTIEQVRALRKAGVATIVYVPQTKQPGFDLLMMVQQPADSGSGQGAMRCMWVTTTLNAGCALKLESRARPAMVDVVREVCPAGDVEVVWWTVAHRLEDMQASVKAVEVMSKASCDVAERVVQYVATHEAE